MAILIKILNAVRKTHMSDYYYFHKEPGLCLLKSPSSYFSFFCSNLNYIMIIGVAYVTIKIKNPKLVNTA